MKSGLKFNHFGIPVKDKKPANYLAGGKVWFNNPDEEPYGVEWLYFEEGSPMPEILQTKAHVAYEVDNLEEAMKGEKTLVPPFDVNDQLRCAFIEHEGIGVELMQFKK
ncbi:MAG: hypothetical protein Q4G69_12615 [Planctomycetia bacterium]|nr:hypothetical protein [Planctomycetia bacterium]